MQTKMHTSKDTQSAQFLTTTHHSSGADSGMCLSLPHFSQLLRGPLLSTGYPKHWGVSLAPGSPAQRKTMRWLYSDIRYHQPHWNIRCGFKMMVLISCETFILVSRDSYP